MIKTALSSPDIQKFSRRGDYAYALTLTEKEGRKLCKNIYGELRASSFKPVGQEVWFSDWSEYKSLPLKTKKGVYKHYKGKLYELLYIAIHSETLENMVVYKALYGDGKIWVRPLSMWSEIITLPDGEKTERFSYAGEVAQKSNEVKL